VAQQGKGEVVRQGAALPPPAGGRTLLRQQASGAGTLAPKVARLPAPAPLDVAARARRSALLAALLTLFAALLVRCAWMSDDAFITLRTVDNAWHGYGLRWNVDERVQSYTHPLWMLLLLPAYGLAGEGYFSTIALSIAVAVAALLVVIAQTEGPAWATLAVVLIAGSRAVVDYAACGLENPLLDLLFAVLAAVVFSEASQRRTALLGLLTALIALTRPDATLVALPALVHAVATSPRWRRALATAALGLAPLAAWEAFSLVYYGSLVSNTAYAKLDVHLPASALVLQGLRYAADSLVRDPLTLAVVALGAGLALRRGGRAEAALGAGVLLYLAAVIRIGGDFMSGRFFGGLLFVCVPLVLRLWPRRRVRFVGALAGLVALGTLALPRSHWRAGSDYGDAIASDAYEHTHGIADERAYYFPETGLVRVIKGYAKILAYHGPVPPYPGAFNGLRARAQNATLAVTKETGFFAYFAGPGVHVVDVFALGDPLLARLPFEPTGAWRIGHFARPLPEGYKEALRGEGAIRDPRIAALYERIRLVTRGPLFTAARWRAMAGL